MLLPSAKVILSHFLTAGLFATFLLMVWAWAWAFRQYRLSRPLIPAQAPRPVPWRLGSILLVIFSWFVANLVTVQTYYAATGRPRKLPLTFIEQMTLVSLINGVLIVLIPLVLRATSGARPRDLGLERAGVARHFRQGAVAFLLVALPVNMINVAFAKVSPPENKHPLEDMVRSEPTGEIAYLAFLSAVILAPAAEELLFRAVIQGWLVRALVGLRLQLVDEEFGSSRPAPVPDEWAVEEAYPAPACIADQPPPPPTGFSALVLDPVRWQRLAAVTAVVVTSVLFALAHWAQWPAPVAIFFLSLALGAVFYRTGSLWASLVLHSLFNGLSTTFLFVAILSGDQALKEATPPQASLSMPSTRSHEITSCSGFAVQGSAETIANPVMQAAGEPRATRRGTRADSDRCRK
jgi:membrane protease YdiL (CAAX protease family)